ncbi:hypothetical protein [Cellulomonas alba]|uniref:HTH cro/C1-type domain-containing protein n=1 Tax=Cellulomonas alba TaxID=3053467 RepID=A0ABT7SF31_9CELL|nr:hypothetical protein [Cellulomonas alba]MDM7854796.1 hypothetical protein [Cellulomonas alba]
MVVSTAGTVAFDGEKLIRALDDERSARSLPWRGLAVELWEQSADLNARLGDDALCPGALHRTAVRGTMSCQYALPLLRWLGRPPEDFLVGDVADVGETALVEAGPDKRLHWDLAELYADLDRRRQSRGLTWAALGAELGCTPSRLTNLRTARQADMGLAMQVTQWLGEPAARYIHATDW